MTASPEATQAEDLTLAQWAARWCAASLAYDAATAANEDGVSPTSLDVPERRARAIEQLSRRQGALEQGIDAFEAMEPPREARAFHKAALDFWQGFLANTKDELVRIEAAETALDIEASNAETGIAYQELSSRLAEATSGTDEAVLAALGGVNDCLD